MSFDPSQVLQFGVTVALAFTGVFILPFYGLKWISRWLWRLKL